MLIPTAEKEFVNSSKEIWLRAVREIFSYCYKKNLLHVWVYFWHEWYRWDRWNLWALSASSEVSVIRMTMSIESHWHMLKRDYLYKFNQPRIDLVCHILTEKLLPVQLHQFQLLLHERILPSWLA